VRGRSVVFLIVGPFIGAFTPIEAFAQAPAAEAGESAPESSDSPRRRDTQDGGWFVHGRFRVETVDQQGPLQSATASTLRTSAGYETNPANTLGFMVEVEDVHAIGAAKFNSTTNGRTEYAVVPDPDGTELNQAYLNLQRSGFRARGGRQAFVLDGQRFFGDVAFRQNQQTFDALTLKATTPGGSRFIYGYLWRANRFLGEDNPAGELHMRTHVLNYSLGRLNGDRLTAYGYLIETDDAPFRASSTQTYGASYDGGADISTSRLLYRAEVAKQYDYADNPGAVDVWYANVEVGWRFANQWVVTLGDEVLSGDGRFAFQTPLGTLHKFNGTADVFAISTPVNGIDDRYVRVYLPLGGMRFTLTAHDFQSERGSQDYGTELDAEVSWRLDTRWLIGAKYADYQAGGFATDTRKAWVWVQADL
jgi:hypothetical protein